MPQYYTGLNPATAASDGLMAGFEFVERIRDRRRQRELQERQMNLAENADQRAEEASDRAAAEYTHLTERRPVLEGREDTVFGQQQEEFLRGRRVRDEVEGARRDLVGALPFGGGASSLMDIGTGGSSRAPAVPTSPATGVRDSEQPTDVRDSVQPIGPVDLRAAQRDIDNAPGFLDKMRNFAAEQREGAKRETARNFWSEVANPKSTTGTVYHSGIGNAVAMRDVRLDPAKYATQYLKDRGGVPVEARASIDLTMSGALKERSSQLAVQIGQLDATDKRNAGKIRQLGDQLLEVNRNMTTLARTATTSAAADAGITRPVKTDDARVAPAVINAATKARGVQEVLETTPDELRAARTLVARAGSAKRLNDKQIAALTTLYAHGEIQAEELNNWSKYGTPIAPKQPTVQPLGNGYAAVVSEAGISLLALPVAKGAETAESRSNRRLLVNDRLKQLNDGMKGMVEAGELSDGSPNQHLTAFLQILKREAPNLQLKSGIPLLGDDGALNLAETDPGEVAELLSNYAAYDAGEKQPWFFKGGKTFTDYAPEASGEEILDLTNAF